MSANEENGCGWVIKAPFTTNGESIRYPKSFDSMKIFMRSLSNLYFGHLPYLMIQPCMYNRKEVKIVVLNEEPLFKAGISTGSNSRSKTGINKCFSDKEGLLAFARQAMERFQSAAPFAITDGLFRVDIFQTLSGKMVVNEFESLDAAYDTVSTGTYDYQALTYNFLQKYWQKKIDSVLFSLAEQN